MEKEKSIYILPDGWCKTSIGKILYLEYGKSLPEKNRVESGKYPVYGSNGKIGNHNESLIKGPVIIVGRKGSVGVVHYEKDDCWPIDTTYFIKTVNSLNDKFIFYLLKTLNLGELDSSTSIPGINRNNVYEKNILLPPFKEQYRIASKIEEIFSELDHAEEGLKKAQKQLEVYKQALLKYAFEGKLTKKWREENNLEPVEGLFKLIKKEREIRLQEEINIWVKNGKKGKRPILHKSSNEEPISFLNPAKFTEIPNNWRWVKVESITDVTMGQSPPSTSYNNSGNGVPLINGPVEFGSSPFSKTLMTKWTTAPTKMCQEGDLILCVRGSTTGRQNVAGFDACIGRGVASIRTILISQKYITYYFHFSEREIYKMGTGTTFPNISNEQIKTYPVPICANKEQEQIVQELDSQFTLVENVVNAINAGFQKIKSFRKIILKKAFEGKLVHQDSTDKSATLLLKQIQSEKETYSKVKKEKMKLKPKKKKTMENKKTVLKLLKESETPIPARELWQLSAYKENIDAFYAEIKELIEKGEIEETERQGKESYLKLTETK